MSFESVALVCPRCRHLSEDRRLVYSKLLVDEGDRGRKRAVPGDLEGVRRLLCPNQACGATYPVIKGIPVVFRAPEAVDLVHNPPYDPLSLPTDTLHALLTGQSPSAQLPMLLARIARYAWAGFHDWLGPEWQTSGVQCQVHGVAVMKWLEALGERQVCKGGVRGTVGGVGDSFEDVQGSPDGDDGSVGGAFGQIVGVRGLLGGALGREVWEAEGPTLLLDGHLPTLLAAQRLIQEGRLPLLFPMTAHGWEAVELTAPVAPPKDVALVCCDIIDPPFEAGVFRSTIATNLIDSVSHPHIAIGQAHALTVDGGTLTITTPFAWRPEVTDPSQWLETFDPRNHSHPDVALEEIVKNLEPPLTVLGKKEFPWALRNSAHEAVVYQSEGWCFSK